MALSNKVNLNNNENVQNGQDDNELQKVKVNFDELVKELYNKEDIKDLPKVTTEERVKYEKEWNESLPEMIIENEKIIKKKYPTLSEKELTTYAIQFTEYTKEDMLRIVKFNSELQDKIENTVSDSELAMARSILALKYAEVLGDFYERNPQQKYKVNEKDLKMLQQYVLENSNQKYTVKIRPDNSGYDLVKVVN